MSQPPGRRFLSSSVPPINTAWKHATILNIVVFEIAKSSSKATGWVDNISILAPELEDAVPGPRREATAIENVLEFKQVTFVESDSSNLHVTADFGKAHTLHKILLSPNFPN
jgi:hypothetical protein